MEESVILNEPLLLVGYGIALLLSMYATKERVGGYIAPILSMLICMLTSVYAFLKAASLYEVGAVLIIFLLMNLSAYKKEDNEGINGRDKK